MSIYKVIKTVDILGDEEFLVIPEPEWDEYPQSDDKTPYWFDSDTAWYINDFTNPEIYQSVELIYVQF